VKKIEALSEAPRLITAFVFACLPPACIPAWPFRHALMKGESL
jgi:hypothetical protein